MDTILVLVFPNFLRFILHQWLIFQILRLAQFPSHERSSTAILFGHRSSHESSTLVFARTRVNHLRADYTGIREVFRSTSVAKAISPTEGQIAATQGPQWWATVRRKNSNKYRPPARLPPLGVAGCIEVMQPSYHILRGGRSLVQGFGL